MYKRIILTADDNAANVQYNQSAVLMHSELYQPSPVDEFYTESVIPVDGSECVFHVDPLIMLFNQQRIDNLGSLTAKQFLDSLQQKESSLSELRKKCSDEDLMAMMKSRYLQTPSEIMSYCRYIESNVDAFNSEVQKIVSEKAAAEKAAAEKAAAEKADASQTTVVSS